MERPAIIALLWEQIHGDTLQIHCLCNGAITNSVAGFLSEDQTRWEEIGIMHEIDFEQVNGDMQQHGIIGARLLKAACIPDETGEMVRPHNHFFIMVPMTVRWKLHSRPRTLHQASLLPALVSRGVFSRMSW